MGNKITLIIFFIITTLLFVFFLNYPTSNSGGDIVEYFGMSESFISHGGVDLTDVDYNKLRKYLNAGYFTDPASTDQNGGFLYYMKGQDGRSYPVHFFFYSLLSVPVRLFLKFFYMDQLITLRLTNLIILTVTVAFILKYFISGFFQRLVFLTLVYLSPIIFFIIWHGPDIYYISFLLLGIFLFYKNKLIPSILCFGMASWQSQPLVVLALGSLMYFVYQNRKNLKNAILTILFLGLLIFVPYIFNYWAFGVFTPWTILDDGWTRIYGFGLQNVHVRKLFEQFFDLNIGLFWYAPILTIGGLFAFLASVRKEAKNLWMLILVVVTAFAYQTNPAWHYGTAGYGPTRHILFIIPFLIYFFVNRIRPNLQGVFLLIIFAMSQIYILPMNSFLAPKFENSLEHSPYAKWVLSRYPYLYNPTPEIFVDRTNHSDLKYIKSAIYKEGTVCKKAFILPGDKELLISECGYIPPSYEQKAGGEGMYVNYQ